MDQNVSSSLPWKMVILSRKGYFTGRSDLPSPVCHGQNSTFDVMDYLGFCIYLKQGPRDLLR